MDATEVQKIVDQALAKHEQRESELADRQRRELMDVVSSVRADLHAISAKLSEVADLRGDLKAMRELLERVARESKELDSRLRKLEMQIATMGQSTKRFDGILDKLIWLVLAGGLGWLASGKLAGVG